MPTSCNIASIGEFMVELSPEPGIRDEPVYLEGIGGDTLNTAGYLRTLLPAARCVSYVTAVGDDAISGRMQTGLSLWDHARDLVRDAPVALLDVLRRFRTNGGLVAFD